MFDNMIDSRDSQIDLDSIHDTSIDYLSVHPPKRLHRTISPVPLNEDYERCGVAIKNLLDIMVMTFPVTMYDTQRSPIIQLQHVISFESDHYQLMTAGWNSACEQPVPRTISNLPISLSSSSSLIPYPPPPVNPT